jgi:carbonic anhydrase
LELDEKKFPNLSCWLKHGKAVKEIVEKMIKDGEIIEDEKRVVTERVSCLQQLDNLLTYPCVKEKFEKGEIKLTAWYFTIEKGSLEYYDVESHSFKPLSTK